MNAIKNPARIKTKVESKSFKLALAPIDVSTKYSKKYPIFVDPKCSNFFAAVNDRATAKLETMIIVQAYGETTSLITGKNFAMNCEQKLPNSPNPMMTTTVLQCHWIFWL